MIENVLNVLRGCTWVDRSSSVVLGPSTSSLLTEAAMGGGTTVILMDSIVSITCGVDVETIVMTRKFGGTQL